LVKHVEAQRRAGNELVRARGSVAFMAELVAFLGVRVDFPGGMAQRAESGALGIHAACTAGTTYFRFGAGSDTAGELRRACLYVADMADVVTVGNRATTDVGSVTQLSQDLALEPAVAMRSAACM
jgi:hypothetical protein